MEARLCRLEGFEAGVLTVVVLFVLGGWDVSAGAVQPAGVEPVDPFQGGELDVVDAAPGPAPTDQLGLVEPDQGLRGGVVVGVADRPDGGDGADLRQSLGVADGQVLPAAEALLLVKRPSRSCWGLWPVVAVRG